jgi:hypothetical protein
MDNPTLAMHACNVLMQVAAWALYLSKTPFPFNSLPLILSRPVCPIYPVDSDSQFHSSFRKQNPGYHSPPSHHLPPIPNPEHKSNAPSTLLSNSPTLSFNPRFSALRSPTVSHATLESFPRQLAHPSSASSGISVSFEDEEVEESVSKRANVDFCCWGLGRWGRGVDVKLDVV